MESVYNVMAGLDVHKKMVVVVVLHNAQPDCDYASGVFCTTQAGLRELVAFLQQHNVTDVAMESTAQYWRPVWMTLENEFTLTLAQARFTRVMSENQISLKTRDIFRELVSPGRCGRYGRCNSMLPPRQG
jgi:hypothetical protein